MKLVTFKENNSLKPGILTQKGVIDIQTNWKSSNCPASVKEIISFSPDCLDQLKRLQNSCNNFLDIDSIELCAPITNPPKLLALAGNYRKHIIEAGLKLGLAEAPENTTVPRPFIMPSTVITAHNATINWPDYSEEIDYEVELAVVIGKPAKNITPQQAIDYIAGYTIANDISARSVTFKTNRAKRPWDEFFDWLGGKWADGFLPIGPCIVTKDEIGNAQDLEMTLKVNGKTRQNANTSNMIHSAAKIVSFLSHIMTLTPGDIIATGTPEGVGMADGNFLKAGDIIEAEIEKIGTLKNTFGQRPKKFYEPLNSK